MSLPFLDLRAAYLELKVEIDTAISRVLNSGWYILGAEVETFEGEFASFCGTKYALGVANGLEALRLSLLAMGVGPGDEVIVPANTFIATWLAVSQCGAKPVAVEPDEWTQTIDCGNIEAALTEHTKAIIPVHLYGLPVDLDPILELAQRHDLLVLEDAAQAHGAKYKGSRLGGHGDAVAWSFYPGKNLGAMGDGGAVTTNRTDLAERLRLLRNYGSRHKYVHEIPGSNSRLDPIQAAVLRVKLQHLEEWNERRREIAGIYNRELAGTGIMLHGVPEWAEPVWHLYVVRHSNRDRLQRSLAEAGIQTLIHYPIPPHKQGAYADLPMPPEGFPLTERLAREVISLPIGPQLPVGVLMAEMDKIKSCIGECQR